MSCEAVVAGIGATRHGIVPVWLARENDVGYRQLRQLVRRGVLVPLGRGVFRLRDHPFTYESRCRALLDVAGEGALVTRRSAARLGEVYQYRSCPAVEALVLRGGDHRTPLRTPLGTIVETRWLPPEHVTTVAGFPATTLARTFFELCADPDGGLPYHHPAHERQMARVYNECLGRRNLTFTQQVAVLTAMAKRGRTGTTLVRKLLLLHGPRYKPTKSDAEALLREILLAYGVEPWEQQHDVFGPDGWIRTADFWWPASTLDVEVDSRWHDGPLDEADDIERDARCRAAGIEVQRYRYGQMVADPAAIVRKINRALERRRA